MLDKLSNKFLEFLDGLPDDTYSYIGDAEYPDEFGNDEKLFAMIRYLEQLNYVEIIKSSSSNADVGVRLSHKGIKRAEFRRQELVKYLEEKWIDFFALLASFAALVISVVALLSKTQG